MFSVILKIFLFLSAYFIFERAHFTFGFKTIFRCFWNIKAYFKAIMCQF